MGPAMAPPALLPRCAHPAVELRHVPLVDLRTNTPLGHAVICTRCADITAYTDAAA